MMSSKAILLIAAGMAALALPLVASAQGYYGQPGGEQSYQPRGDQGYYGQPYGDEQYYGQPDGDQRYPSRGEGQYSDQPRGDWYGDRRTSFRGYPEFRRVEAHIRAEISDGVREDLLAPEDAAEFYHRLRDIQVREQREYRAHGWNLPGDDRADIRRQLDNLDGLVDRTRDEP